MARHAHTGTEFGSIDTLDGPVIDVGRTEEHVTFYVQWSAPQRWYLTADEARKMAEALAEAADALELDTICG